MKSESGSHQSEGMNHTTRHKARPWAIPASRVEDVAMVAAAAGTTPRRLYHDMVERLREEEWGIATPEERVGIAYVHRLAARRGKHNRQEFARAALGWMIELDRDPDNAALPALAMREGLFIGVTKFGREMLHELRLA